MNRLSTLLVAAALLFFANLFSQNGNEEKKKAPSSTNHLNTFDIASSNLGAAIISFSRPCLHMQMFSLKA
jgi:hypothetical protein